MLYTLKYLQACYRVVQHTAGAGPQLHQDCSLQTRMLQGKGPDIMRLHQIMTPVCRPCKAWRVSLSSPTAPRGNHGPCLNKVMCLRLRQDDSLLPGMLHRCLARNRAHLKQAMCLKLPQNGSLLPGVLHGKGPHMVSSGQCPLPSLEQISTLYRDDLIFSLSTVPCLHACLCLTQHTCCSQFWAAPNARPRTHLTPSRDGLTCSVNTIPHLHACLWPCSGLNSTCCLPSSISQRNPQPYILKSSFSAIPLVYASLPLPKS